MMKNYYIEYVEEVLENIILASLKFRGIKLILFHKTDTISYS